MVEVWSNPELERRAASIPPQGQQALLVLIVAQAAHSIEEYIFRLYDVFAPARWVSGLISDNLAAGFVIANAAVVSFGTWSYVARVRPKHPSARTFAWFWVGLEFANGVGHSLIAVSQGGYFPGVATAPLLIAIAIYLASRLSTRPSAASGG